MSTRSESAAAQDAPEISPADRVHADRIRAERSSKLLGLTEVEDLIRSKLEAEAGRLTEIATYLLDLGGKRVRPALSLLCARLCGLEQPSQQLLDVAAGIELIHMATLLHDDIIDKSPMRRHSASPFHKFGLADTLLCGDFLLVRAFSLCARLDRHIIDATEIACVELTEGEILETPLGQTVHTSETSLTIARKKTASLFRLAANSGSHLAGVKGEGNEAFAVFGEKLGMAFQILDDILDVTSPEDLLGKKTGTDLRERKPSIVNVLWCQTNSALASKLFADENPSEELIAAAVKEICAGEVVPRARGLARGFAEEALSALAAGLETVPREKVHDDSRVQLEALVKFCLERLK